MQKEAPLPYQRIAVLVVEDEALIRFSITDELTRLGFDVLEAPDARTAVELLARHPNIQVLFTDINMPGDMDGLHLAALVRNRWPSIKIIVTSGKSHLDPDDLPVEGRFIDKPYNPVSVVAAISDLTGL